MPGAPHAPPRHSSEARGSGAAEQVKLRQGRAFNSGQIFLCARPSEHLSSELSPSHASLPRPAITRTFNCMPRCPTDIFPTHLATLALSGTGFHFNKINLKTLTKFTNYVAKILQSGANIFLFQLVFESVVLTFSLILWFFACLGLGPMHRLDTCPPLMTYHQYTMAMDYKCDKTNI